MNFLESSRVSLHQLVIDDVWLAGLFVWCVCVCLCLFMCTVLNGGMTVEDILGRI